MPRSEVLYHGQGRNLDRDFCSMRTTVSPLGPQHRVPEPVPSLETHLESEYVKGRPNGCRYVGRKEETRMKSNGRQVKKSGWNNTKIWKAKGKAMDQHGPKLRI